MILSYFYEKTFVFTTQIVQFLSFLNPKFPASNHLLGLYSPVCVGPGRNTNCWFSHALIKIIISKHLESDSCLPLVLSKISTNVGFVQDLDGSAIITIYKFCTTIIQVLLL